MLDLIYQNRPSPNPQAAPLCIDPRYGSTPYPTTLELPSTRTRPSSNSSHLPPILSRLQGMSAPLSWLPRSGKSGELSVQKGRGSRERFAAKMPVHKRGCTVLHRSQNTWRRSIPLLTEALRV